MRKKRVIPLGVKIVSLLSYLRAAVVLVLALLMITGGSLLKTYFGLVSIVTLSVIVMSLLAFALLNFFIGRGLWQGQPWSRITLIVLSCIGIIGALIIIMQSSLFGFAVIVANSVIGGYLLLNKKAKSYFL